MWGIVGRDHIDFHPSPNRAEREWVRGTRVRIAAPEDLASIPKTPLGSRSLVLLTLGYAAVGYFQYLFFYWAGEYYFKDVMHLSIAQSRTNTTLLILALGVGMPVGGWLADRMQRRFPGPLGWRLVPATAMGLSAGFLFLGLVAHSPVAIVSLFALAMFSLGASESSFWQAAIVWAGDAEAPRRPSSTPAATVLDSSPRCSPPSSAPKSDGTGAVAIGGIVGLLGAACWLGIDPTRPNPETSARKF